MRLRSSVAGGLIAAALLSGCGGGSVGAGQVTTSGETTTTTTLPGNGRPPIVVGDKNTTEQFILGQLYAKALAGQGFSVELNQNIGPTEVTLQALSSGLLDMYPEYLNVWDGEIAGLHRTFHSPDAALRAGQRFARRRALRLLAPTRFDDVPAVVVTDAFARAHRLRSNADLSRVAATIVFGGAPQFGIELAGLPALEQAYGFFALSYLPVALGEQYSALDSGAAQAVQGSTTDGQLATGGYRVLADPQRVFGWGEAVPVVAAGLAQGEGPAFVTTIDRVSNLLTTQVMRELNAAVDVYHQDPGSVAEQFLQSHGLVPTPVSR